MTGRVLLLLSAGLLAACASAPSPVPVREMEVSVRISSLPEAGAWEVRYQFSKPLQVARFVRSGYGLRLRHWRILEPAHATLQELDGRDFLTSKDGTAIESLRVRVETFAEKPEKDYAPFVPFTVGGALVYTEHFNVEPLKGGPSAEAEALPVRTRFTLVPREGERVVVAGTASRDAVQWEARPQGTYAFFGTVLPVQGEGLTAVVDPGFPPALREQMERGLPQLFALYAARTGQALHLQPVVFLRLGQEEEARSISTNGGVLPGLVQLDVRLGAEHLARPSSEVGERLWRLLAHEAAHLWNGQMFDNEVQGGDWMHEGGAEAFMYRGLRELGLLSEAAYLAQLSEATSSCLLGLEGRALMDSSRPGASRNYYTCGLLLSQVAESSAREDIFSLWGRLFRAADARGRYDDVLFFWMPDEAGVEPSILASLQRLVREPDPQATEHVLETLKAAGIDASVDDAAASREYQRQVASRAARQALTRECTKLSMVQEGSGILAVKSVCEKLGPSAKLTEVAGHPLSTGALAAYDALREQCTNSGSVEVKTAGATAPIRMACGPDVPRRTPFIRVHRLP